MKLTRLKLTGFKSFVEPTEFFIEPGLTGVVGPNGCGKSNLVEALRWVMGESSFKNMRASGMDDVIFGGSGSRPARNMAEVGLSIDNSGRTAPAGFNDTDLLEVTRKIERDEGSTYRVNGKEVRARDIQLLFADAATGARSPALVRQGQISEIISAKPQSRRRLLEDAAGIAGLHSRRHEAELRLRGAEDNLTRVEDILREIDTQVESLSKQAKQAGRYKGLAADIRKAEALLALIHMKDAQEQRLSSERELESVVRDVAAATAAQAGAAREQAIAAQALPALRDAEVSAAAALVRIKRALEDLEAEDRRLKLRATELERRLVELAADLQSAARMRDDADSSLERLKLEDSELAIASNGATAAETSAKTQLAESEALLAASEAQFAEIQGQISDVSARRSAVERAIREAETRLARHKGECERLEREMAALDVASGGGQSLEELRRVAETAIAAGITADETAITARNALAKTREAEQAARAPLTEADRLAQRLETEVRTLQKLLSGGSGDLWPPILDEISAAKGYETALGAALGEDLDASSNPTAPTHWFDTGDGSSDAKLPTGADPLSTFVRAPVALLRRLNQIGVVGRGDGSALRGLLKPGQRLVSREGDIWRWDGFTTAAEAPSAAARRLAEKNRLGDLERDAQAAREKAEIAREFADAAQINVRNAVQAETTAIEAARRARIALDEVRTKLVAAERKAADQAARRSALTEAIERLRQDEQEASAQVQAGHTSFAGLGDTSALDQSLLAMRATVGEGRAAAAEARSTVQTLLREQDMRTRRSNDIATELKAWGERIARSSAAVAEANARSGAAIAEQKILAEAPDTFLVRRREILAELERAEKARSDAADALVSADTSQMEADKAARIALEALSGVREARAACEARLEAALARVADVQKSVAENLETDHAGLQLLAGISAGDALPSVEGIDRKLQGLKADRERMGAVNLRADDELLQAEEKRDTLIRERDDLTEAIRKLRGAIGALNREGRERLLAAFDVVNGHFKALFTVLFNGGEAELRLVDADDPLESGLEIFARPPGKKPQVMSLLSGGEQALTATALIFAVFLTNPSPICVLDEVDAPLDDANVERYCDLLREMIGQTETRFVVITHNPITMARMDRLYGVTMAERGVSQLVSVDLSTAERIREAS
jgi:chromosome segregation protein